MKDLRENLAERFADVLDPYLGHEGYWPGGAEAMADECIRQMEWAAQNAFDSCCNRGMLPQDLTPAPDDWTPTPTKE